MRSVPMCGYGCGAHATVDFLWPIDAEVWHVCDHHAKALQRMLDEQIGSEWAARVVRWPSQGRDGELGPPRMMSGDPMTPTEGGTVADRLGNRLWPLLRRVRNWLMCGR